MKLYASHPQQSRGRVFAEPECNHRSMFQRDRDRVIHAVAFRRLKHKTQVFVEHEGDHYRTRLTHTLEVAQIARTLAHALEVEEALAETIALAHDLGHPPFGHAGERALDLTMRPYGGFDHNAQALRVVTHLECRYADFDGLNLCWESLDGMAKHNGPATSDGEWPGIEAQLAALADDIAYIAHDLDDGLRSGLLDLDELRPLPILDQAFLQVDRAYPRLELPRQVGEVLRRVFATLVSDVLDETRRRLMYHRPQSAQDIYQMSGTIAGFSKAVEGQKNQLKQFLNTKLYRHPKVMGVMHQAELLVSGLFAHFLAHSDDLPPEWRQIAKTPVVIKDYIAGMTDRYARQRGVELLGFDMLSGY